MNWWMWKYLIYQEGGEGNQKVKRKQNIEKKNKEMLNVHIMVFLSPSSSIH